MGRQRTAATNFVLFLPVFQSVTGGNRMKNKHVASQLYALVMSGAARRAARVTYHHALAVDDGDADACVADDVVV